MIWVREVGRHDAPHVHILIFVPPWLMDGDFQSALERAFEPEGGPTHDKAIFIQPAGNPRGKLLYMLKGLRPKDAKEFGVRASFQGEVEGKRVAVTENIGSRARQRYCHQHHQHCYCYWIRKGQLAESAALKQNTPEIVDNSDVVPAIMASKFGDHREWSEPILRSVVHREYRDNQGTSPAPSVASGARG
jgi:hypothetical protein